MFKFNDFEKSLFCGEIEGVTINQQMDIARLYGNGEIDEEEAWYRIMGCVYESEYQNELLKDDDCVIHVDIEDRYTI